MVTAQSGPLGRSEGRLNEVGTGLSGGQQQRLCIARATAVKPRVILMDEPCSALDPIATAIIEELIDELRNNFSIIIVTHSMQQATRVSQRTAFFIWAILSKVEKQKIYSHHQKMSALKIISPARLDRIGYCRWIIHIL